MTHENLLVHACCGECLAAVLDPGRQAGRVTVFWFNPNVQPLLEFRRRLKSVQVLCDHEHVDLLVDPRYDPGAFFDAVPRRRPERCLACYRLRLDRAASVAAERGFETFTTTLLTSAHQDHDAVRRAGEKAAGAYGVAFHYEDWRPRADRGKEEARRRSLYRQQYCGCIFSEQERYADTREELYRGEHPGTTIEGDSA